MDGLHIALANEMGVDYDEHISDNYDCDDIFIVINDRYYKVLTINDKNEILEMVNNPIRTLKYEGIK